MFEMALTQICQRYVWGMDRDQYPDGWLSEDDNKENPDEQAQMAKWKRCVAAFIVGLYGRHQEIGIIYENIVANIIGVETRTGLYDELGIDPPDTGREDDGTDAIPTPKSNFDPFRGFIMNDPPPAQPNQFRMQIQNDDPANEPERNVEDVD